MYYKYSFEFLNKVHVYIIFKYMQHYTDLIAFPKDKRGISVITI